MDHPEFVDLYNRNDILHYHVTPSTAILCRRDAPPIRTHVWLSAPLHALPRQTLQPQPPCIPLPSS